MGSIGEGEDVEGGVAAVEVVVQGLAGSLDAAGGGAAGGADQGL